MPGSRPPSDSCGLGPHSDTVGVEGTNNSAYDHTNGKRRTPPAVGSSTNDFLGGWARVYPDNGEAAPLYGADMSRRTGDESAPPPGSSSSPPAAAAAQTTAAHYHHREEGPQATRSAGESAGRMAPRTMNSSLQQGLQPFQTRRATDGFGGSPPPPHLLHHPPPPAPQALVGGPASRFGKPRASFVALDGFGSFPMAGPGGLQSRPSGILGAGSLQLPTASSRRTTGGNSTGGGTPASALLASRMDHAHVTSPASLPGAETSPPAGASSFLPPAVLLGPGAPRSSTLSPVRPPGRGDTASGRVQTRTEDGPSAHLLPHSGPRAAAGGLHRSGGPIAQFLGGALEQLAEATSSIFASGNRRVAPAAPPFDDDTAGAGQHDHHGGDDAVSPDDLAATSGRRPSSRLGGGETDDGPTNSILLSNFRKQDSRTGDRRAATTRRSVSFEPGTAAARSSSPSNTTTSAAAVIAASSPSLPEGGSTSSLKGLDAHRSRRTLRGPPMQRQRSLKQSAVGLSHRVSRLIARSVSKMLRTDSGEELEAAEGRRLWGVVRSVVMVGFEHRDISLAFDKLHTKTGRRSSTVTDPTKYLMMWKTARINYIRQRLRGEWFPPPEAAPSDRRGWLLHPNGFVRRSFDSILMIFVLYNAIEVPFFVGLNPPETAAVNTLDTVITCLFALDIVMAFNTSLLEAGRSGMVNTSRRDIAREYLAGWFWIDIAATFPFDTIIKAALGSAGQGGGHGSLRLLGFLKTPRLLRLAKLLRFLDKMKGAQYFKLLRLTFLILMIAHWVACAYCFLASFESSSPTWIDISEQASFDDPLRADSGNVWELYATAFYQGWTMLTGNGASCFTIEEKLFVSFVMMLGGFVQAVIVGNMSLIVQARAWAAALCLQPENFDAAASRYRSQSEYVMSTARYLELPHELQERIRFYYEHMMGTSHPGDDGMHELAKLPKKLYEDIVTALHGQALDAVPLLRGLEPTFIAELAQRVTSHILLPDEAVFKEGDISREMYFITHGVLVVGEAGAGHAASKIDGGVVSEIRAGSFFGELALLTDIRRSSTVHALTVCDINILTRASLVEVLAEYPEVELIVRQRGRRRLNEMQEIEQEGDEEEEEEAAGAWAAPPDDGAPPARSGTAMLRSVSFAGGGEQASRQATMTAPSPRVGREELMLTEGVGLDAELDLYESSHPSNAGASRAGTARHRTGMHHAASHGSSWDAAAAEEQLLANSASLSPSARGGSQHASGRPRGGGQPQLASTHSSLSAGGGRAGSIGSSGGASVTGRRGSGVAVRQEPSQTVLVPLRETKSEDTPSPAFVSAAARPGGELPPNRNEPPTLWATKRSSSHVGSTLHAADASAEAVSGARGSVAGGGRLEDSAAEVGRAQLGGRRAGEDRPSASSGSGITARATPLSGGSSSARSLPPVGLATGVSCGGDSGSLPRRLASVRRHSADGSSGSARSKEEWLEAMPDTRKYGAAG